MDFGEILSGGRQELRRGTVVLACLLLLRTPGYGYALLEDLREQIETCRRTPRPEPSRDCVARAVEALQAELVRRRQRAP